MCRFDTQDSPWREEKFWLIETIVGSIEDGYVALIR